MPDCLDANLFHRENLVHLLMLRYFELLKTDLLLDFVFRFTLFALDCACKVASEYKLHIVLGNVINSTFRIVHPIDTEL